MKKNPLNPQGSGNDPFEDLRKENELLKLKLTAETGAHFGAVSNLDPVIENEFLKNVIEFEKKFVRAGRKTVYEILGKPAYLKTGEIADKFLASELARINKILMAHNIVVDFLAEYPDRV